MVQTTSEVVMIGGSVRAYPRAVCTVPECWTNGATEQTVAVAAAHVRKTGHQVILTTESHRVIGLPE